MNSWNSSEYDHDISKYCFLGHEMALEKYLKEKGMARNGNNLNPESLNHINRSGSIAWAT